MECKYYGDLVITITYCKETNISLLSLVRQFVRTQALSSRSLPEFRPCLSLHEQGSLRSVVQANSKTTLNKNYNLTHILCPLPCLLEGRLVQAR